MQFPNISPVAFSIFGFGIRWYAIAYITGFICAFFYIKYLFRQSTNNTISYTALDDMFSYIIMGVIFGGRLGYTIFYNLDYYIHHPLHIFAIWEGGMSFHGGMLGVILGIALWCKNNKQKFLHATDFIVQAVPMGLFFGRIANFVNAELYGRITTSPLGVIFPNTDGLPRHPSQIYEALCEGIIIFFTLMFLRKIKSIKNRYGILSFTFLGLYGFFRIIIENFREPDSQIGFLSTGLTMGQTLSIPMLLTSIGCIIYLYTKPQEQEIFASSSLLETDKIKTRFFTRVLGVSTGVFANANCKFETSDTRKNVKQNRKLLLETIGFDANTQLATVNQQHTKDIIVIDTPNFDTQKALNIIADGIITNQNNIAVGVITADCVPLLISDEKTGYIGAIHCGWQGIYKNIVHETIQKMINLGSNIKDIKIALGPCLKQQSYEVDVDFVEKITAQNPAFKKLFKHKRRNKKYLFNCTQYCIEKLKIEGVKTSNIDILNFNTYKQNDLFFSYRRSVITGDYTNNTPTDEGRQLSMIAKTNR